MSTGKKMTRGCYEYIQKREELQNKALMNISCSNKKVKGYEWGPNEAEVTNLA